MWPAAAGREDTSSLLEMAGRWAILERECRIRTCRQRQGGGWGGSGRWPGVPRACHCALSVSTVMCLLNSNGNSRVEEFPAHPRSRPFHSSSESSRQLVMDRLASLTLCALHAETVSSRRAGGRRCGAAGCQCFL